MHRYIRVGDYTWWMWLTLAVLLFLGLIVDERFFTAALAFSFVQAAAFTISQRGVRPFAAQLRAAYFLLVLVLYWPPLRVLYWLPAIGTALLCFTGYCIMARLLSLLPWNRTEPLTLRDLVRTFVHPPNLDAHIGDRAASGCAGGVCTLEVQLGRRTA